MKATMARKSAKKDKKGVPTSVGKFDVNAGLQANAFTQVRTKSKSGTSSGKKQLPILNKRHGRDDEEEDNDSGDSEDGGPGDYESKPRTFERSQKKQRKERLPIKTNEGIIRPLEEESEGEDESEEEGQSGDSDGEDEMERDGEIDGDAQMDSDSGKNEEHSAKPLPTKAEQRQQILEAKEELAQIALSLNEDPEENVQILPPVPFPAFPILTIVPSCRAISSAAFEKSRTRPSPQSRNSLWQPNSPSTNPSSRGTE